MTYRRRRVFEQRIAEYQSHNVGERATSSQLLVHSSPSTDYRNILLSSFQATAVYNTISVYILPRKSIYVNTVIDIYIIYVRACSVNDDYTLVLWHRGTRILQIYACRIYKLFYFSNVCNFF